MLTSQYPVNANSMLFLRFNNNRDNLDHKKNGTMRVNDLGLGYDFKPFLNSPVKSLKSLNCKMLSGLRNSKSSDYSADIEEFVFETKFITSVKKIDFNLGLSYNDENDKITGTSIITKISDLTLNKQWSFKKINFQNNLNFVFRDETEYNETNLKNGFSITFIRSDKISHKIEYNINYLNRTTAGEDSLENKISLKNEIKLDKKENILLTVKGIFTDYNYEDNASDYTETEFNTYIKIKF